MSKLATKLMRAAVSPEVLLQKIVSYAVKADESKFDPNDEKFIINRDGSLTLNRHNLDVQKAFADNIRILKTKK